MTDILEQIDFMVANPHFEIISDDELFSKMANFIISIDPDLLDDRQLANILEIVEDFEAVDELEEEVKAKKETMTKKQYAGKYYRQNKQKIKKKKTELERSIKGKNRNRMAPIMARGRKTPTGRHKVSYNG
jgi:hypothetical protein